MEYLVLGVDEHATQVEVDRALKRFRVEHHPDRHPSSVSVLMQRATHMAVEAHRRIYEQRRAAAAVSRVACGMSARSGGASHARDSGKHSTMHP